MSIEIKVPSVGESITEVVIAKWMKNEGEHVELDQVLCELETDKATFEINAETSGILHITVQEGETVNIGSTIGTIEEGAARKPVSSPEKKPEAKKAENTSPAPEESKESYAAGHPSPAAAKIMSEKGFSPEEVKGSGKDGRITKEDALQAEKKKSTEFTTGIENRVIKETVPDTRQTSQQRQDRREKMTTLRKTIARRLVAVKNETAMLTTFNEIDMTEIMALRKKYKAEFKEKYEIGLGFMSFFTKAACIALQEFPVVNASVENDEIIYHDYCDISIAVSAPKGLVVPVIRNAETLSFDEIEKEIASLAKKARDNKLSIDEMSGGTFTITNGGIFGSMLSTPLINAPQSAIMGMHNIQERAMVINGEIKVRPVMYLALSYDHRIIDGKDSVSFLVRVKQLLEDPARLLLKV